VTEPSLLPARAGARPRTSTEIPHSQLDQQPPDSRYVDGILAEALTWPSVRERPSRISVEGARALTLDTAAAAGPVEAFMVGHEFCHVHAQGDHSLHATLPLRLATGAERAGWAEPHFLVHTGQAPATVVMLYAPRDQIERDVVLGLVRASYEFACTPASPGNGDGRSARVSPYGQEAAVAIHVVAPNDGEPSGGGPIRCRIIEDGSHTQHRLGLIEAVVPPGPGGPPQHIHREHDETFIVTRGKLRFSTGADDIDVAAGTCVTVPLGTPHTFSNPFAEPATFICTLTPDRYIEYFRDLSRLATGSNGQLDPADVGRAMATYGTEVVR
jgi:mannose-6-phosphate isomerase-like protein (cupin superfamily)